MTYQEKPPVELSPSFKGTICPQGFDGDGHGGAQIRITWGLACACGAEFFQILAYSWNNPDVPDHGPVTLSPLTATCSACSKSAVIFDCRLHGYAPRAYDGCETVCGETEPDATHGPLRCDSCGGDRLKPRVTYEYPLDLFDDDCDFAKGMERDFYTWFSLQTECAGCGHRQGKAELECA